MAIRRAGGSTARVQDRPPRWPQVQSSVLATTGPLLHSLLEGHRGHLPALSSIYRCSATPRPKSPGCAVWVPGLQSHLGLENTQFRPTRCLSPAQGLLGQ